jgi:hypothetical protein
VQEQKAANRFSRFSYPLNQLLKNPVDFVPAPENEMMGLFYWPFTVTIICSASCTSKKILRPDMFPHLSPILIRHVPVYALLDVMFDCTCIKGKNGIKHHIGLVNSYKLSKRK